MKRSVLRFRQVASDGLTDAPLVMLLHGNKGGMDDLISLAGALEIEGRLIAPEAARGVYSGIERVSSTWYGGELLRPEPASFGDSLAQIELLARDVTARWPSGQAGPWLIGVDQGAVLALTLATLAETPIAGVVAINGCLPQVARVELPIQPRMGLPIHLVIDPGFESISPSALDSTTDRLTAHGYDVTMTSIESATNFGSEVVAAIRSWITPRIAAVVAH